MTDIYQMSKDNNDFYPQTHYKAVLGLTEAINLQIKDSDNSSDFYTKEEVASLVKETIKETVKDYYTKEEVKTMVENATAGGSTEPDLSGYYTKNQIDQIITAIPTSDLSDYYTKEAIDEMIKKVSSLNLSDYPTKEDMTTAIKTAVTSVGPDMSGFYTKEEMDEKFGAIKIPDTTSLVTKEDLTTSLNEAISAKLNDYVTVTGATDVVNTAVTDKLGDYYTSADTDKAITDATSAFGSGGTSLKTQQGSIILVDGYKDRKFTFTKVGNIIVFQINFSECSTTGYMFNFDNVPQWAWPGDYAFDPSYNGVWQKQTDYKFVAVNLRLNTFRISTISDLPEGGMVSVSGVYRTAN
ncbi:hypothetical protein [Companilactobacillus mishanensis]|uniref:Uncharacterized protein n=1 Tax=Companilactobacillus mishanensis TaxID=2486008 RepID=A0A5P0ZF68_9LACO|nr:hypothetical protein [Companilactobacillus mishanensis]MQS44237.1 hypothetical protein [Companilactobacillus mishanensis]MQS51658.1 hypothetical protein [Companilactobacillus mishanensis]